MKKLLYLLPVSALFVFSTLASETNLQDELAAQMKDELGVILIRNDTHQPVQIHDGQIGKTMLCFSADLKTFALYPVRKDMFQGGQSSALARCRDRQIFISKGYV
jgi:polyhydroxyalkanoate synthesis regulator protein